MAFSPFAGSATMGKILGLSPAEKGAAAGRDSGGKERGCGAGGVERIVDRHLVFRDAAGARIPRIRERVWVEGQSDPFFVVYVDRDRQVADVVCAVRVGYLLEQVPFSSLRSAETGSGPGERR